MLKRKLHRIFIDFFNACDQLIELKRLRVRVAIGRGVIPRVLWVEHTLKAKHHIIGIQYAGGLKIIGALKGNIFT